MAKNWISLPRVEGTASRQAHVNLPPGTYEREMGKEGFFGPATHMYHRHPPTGWVEFEGPLQPRAFDTVKLAVGVVCMVATANIQYGTSHQTRSGSQINASESAHAGTSATAGSTAVRAPDSRCRLGGRRAMAEPPLLSARRDVRHDTS